MQDGESVDEASLAQMKLSDLEIESNKSIGKGAYGHVHMAIHKPTGKQLAVKKMHKESL